MMEPVIDQKYQNAAQIICRQGHIPFPVNETVMSILKIVFEDNEDELDFISAFEKKASQTMDELRESSGLIENQVQDLTSRIAKKGLIFNQPNSKGTMVIRLLPLMTVGLMEYTFMGELKGDTREQRLAELFERLILDFGDKVQENYDSLIPIFEKAPPVDRTVPARTTDDNQDIKIIPLDKRVKVSEEFILPTQSVMDIINKFDDIAVGRCFCRQRRRMLGEPCSTDAPLMNCFTFGKSARHTIAQEFMEGVTKEKAVEIMREAEDAGLVHKAFHPGSDVSRPETSICNCCKDCCDTLKIWRNGAAPLNNSTYYLSMIDQEKCIGCGTCVERCPTEAISLSEDGIAVREETACFGCGVCAHFCPENAISLKEGLRRVFILPPRLRKVSS